MYVVPITFTYTSESHTGILTVVLKHELISLQKIGFVEFIRTQVNPIQPIALHSMSARMPG